jgi:hypothetical protein
LNKILEARKKKRIHSKKYSHAQANLPLTALGDIYTEHALKVKFLETYEKFKTNNEKYQSEFTKICIEYGKILLEKFDQSKEWYKILSPFHKEGRKLDEALKNILKEELSTNLDWHCVFDENNRLGMCHR